MTGIDMASFYTKICPLIIRQLWSVCAGGCVNRVSCVLEWKRKEMYYIAQLSSHWLEAGLICHEYQDCPMGYSCG